LVGVGVNVTEAPVQILLDDAAMLTAGVTEGFTVMVTLLEVAVGVEGQAAVEVITAEITSALAKDELVKVDPVPALTPFTFH
jgi:hypothetical protein